jgi:hypothetical protein
MPLIENVQASAPRAAYTISSFCEAYAISPRMYFKMRDAGWGPREMGIGRAVRITFDAAADWALACEQLRKDRQKAIATEAAPTVS